MEFAPGEIVELCDGRKHEAQYSLSVMEQKRALLKRVGEARENSAESRAHVILYAAILKKEYFKWIAQKVTECGATEIVPLLSERVVKKQVKLERLQDIVKEAAEQSGSGIVPTIYEPLSLKAALAHAKMNTKNYFFTPILPPFPRGWGFSLRRELDFLLVLKAVGRMQRRSWLI